MNDRSHLLDRYRAVRARTLALAAPLSAEDQVVQPMAEASPTKWHLAHTTWFFEAMVLGREGDAAFDPSFGFLFNSYYETVGPRIERGRRGLLTRPSLDVVHRYRAEVDRSIERALPELDDIALAKLELGLHHEQQHQELVLTDLKYTLGTQPGCPSYRTELAASAEPPSGASGRTPGWREFRGQLVEIGAAATGFAFDNERPRHQAVLRPFRIATRPIVNAEVIAFIGDGGYRDPRWWLSDGWTTVRSECWERPLYWAQRGSEVVHYTLAGVRALDPDEPACHLSYYEADAIARWLGARLPTEAEWEHACTSVAPERGNFADDDRLHPARSPAADGALHQVFGDVWEWTASSYAPYPGFRPLAGVLGEYNGKFMSGQQVLRGGSCFTPRDHVRASYRNFFPPAARWQMSGARIATDA